MKKIIIVFISFLFICNALSAMEKADFKQAEKFAPENLRKMIGTRNVTPVWIDGTNSFYYEFSKSDRTEFFLVDPKKRTKRILFNNKKLAKKLATLSGEKIDPEGLKFTETVFSKRSGIFRFSFKNKQYIYHISKNRLLLSTAKKFDDKKLYKKSPDGHWIIYTRSHNIFLQNLKLPNSEPRQLTTDGEQWYSYSKKEEDVKGENVSGTIAEWFPDSSKIYTLRKDKRKVEDLFLVHSVQNPRPSLESYKYAMAGDKNIPRFSITVIDVNSGKSVDIDTEKWKDQQIGSEGTGGVYTGKGSSLIYFTRTSRDWKDVELCEADTSTGKVRVLLQERSEPYWSADFQQFHLTGDDGKFIWWSEKSGRGHLYLHDKNGKELQRITRGQYTVTNILNVNEKEQYIAFSANGMDENEDPYYRKYYRIAFDGGNLKELTPEKGTHTIHLSPDKNCFVDTYSTIDTPDISLLKDINGTIIMELETLDTAKLLSSGWKPPIKFKVKAADNKTDLYGVMWKPFRMEDGRKYPVISYVYPGPQGEPVPKTFFLVRNNRVSNIPLAQLGFIVITVGQRGGSPLRTREYHNYGYGNARDYPLADNKYAIEQLADKYDFIDIEKVGIYGRSGGGFMSAAAILVYPDFYKAAVSSCGNHDNNIYDYVWGEIHYGLEKKITTNIEKAGDLKGRLLLIHGEVDNNVHPANTLRLANELIKKGKRFDMMIFPGKRHAYDEYTPYIERMMWFYFSEHLMGDRRENIDIFKHK